MHVMSTERNCPECGKALASDAPEGLCAACLIKAGAQLLDKEPNDLQQRVRDGRIELFIDRLIPPGDSLEIIYHYRLPGP